jgi:clathrin heavy chain
VQRVNSARTPQAVGGPDVGCGEETINSRPIDEFVDEVEKRNRLKIILPWVEANVGSGLQVPGFYNAREDSLWTNNNPQTFLPECT